MSLSFEGPKPVGPDEKPVRQSGPIGRGQSLRLPVGATLSAVVVAFSFPLLCLAAAPIPGEEHVGILYTITHLHWAAYLILLIIFVLSVLNLIYQSRAYIPEASEEGHARSRNEASRRRDGSPAGRPFSSSEMGRSGREPLLGAGSHPEVYAPPDGSSVGQARRVQRTGPVGSSQPTPLDGVNHPLPPLRVRGDNGSGAPKTREEKSEKQPQSRPFRFTSAVDLPSPEEVERREREKLVVTGTVKGVDGKGIASVLVYLTDEAGNRLGQSCRSLPDTGEFKVQINEPGRYVLNAYKRGFTMEKPVPPVLPVESGKIEGYSLQMIPEGCLVHGKVLTEGGGEPPEGLKVTCVRKGGDFSRSEPIGTDGEFRFFGVPHDSEYVLEVRGPDGVLLSTSAQIETSRKREVSCEIQIPSPQKEQAGQSRGSEEEGWSNDEESNSELADESPSDHAPRT